MNQPISNEVIYWIRYEFAFSGKRLTDVVEFGSLTEMDLALARLAIYEGEDYLLASSGERPMMSGDYEHDVPRSWLAFLKALEDARDSRLEEKAKPIPTPRQPMPKGVLFPVAGLILFFVLIAVL